MRHTESQQPHKRWLEPLTIILAALIVATALFISRADEEQTRPEVVAVPGLLPAGVPFTPAVRAGGLIFLSGQVGIRPGTFELVDGGMEAEARQTMENIGSVLDAAGAGFEDDVADGLVVPGGVGIFADVLAHVQAAAAGRVLAVAVAEEVRM